MRRGASVAAFLVVLASVLATQALALPELLGQENATESTTLKTSQKFVVEGTNGVSMACSSLSGESVQETDTLGAFHWHLTGCESLSFICTSPGDDPGVVLMLGTDHYVFDVLGPALGVAILFLPEEQTFRCTALVTLKLKGTFLCLVLEPLLLGNTHEFHCSQKEKGVPFETLWWNDEGVEQRAQLLLSKNGGVFLEAAVQVLATRTFAKSVAFMNE